MLAAWVCAGLMCAGAGCGEPDAADPELDPEGDAAPFGPDGAPGSPAPGVDGGASAQLPDADPGGGSLDGSSDASGGGSIDGSSDASDVGAPLDAASDGAIAPDASDAAADGASTPDGGTASDPAPALPTQGGTCPTFATGDATFSPAGIAARTVRLWVGANGGGPLVIYWHSTGAQPSEAETAGLSGVISQITAAGGVVAAPYTGANDGTFPWLSTTSESLKVADEVVACAVEKKNIDPRRIHVLGFSAGGLMTSTMSFQRSAYVASVAPYSGGQQGSPSFQDATNEFAALIFHGGSSDTFLLNFQSTSTTYSNTLRSNGNYTMLCNHGGGHKIPSGGPAAAWRFFQDHPYRTKPSPYVAGGVPASIPSYCQPPP